jgi:hypothetical protein
VTLMLKRTTIVLGRFLQQIFLILVLTVFIVLVLVGVILYPTPVFYQADKDSSIHESIQVPFLMPSDNSQG